MAAAINYPIHSMNKSIKALTCVAVGLCQSLAGAESAKPVVRVALFGGSSVLTSYLPGESKHHTQLQSELSKTYPNQAIEISNFADNGEYIARYLLRGAYERHRVSQPGIDLAIIRFGTNDQKHATPEEYRNQLDRFVELLESDFPGIQIILETGTYVDFPAHYSFDRNVRLRPYWQAARDLAEEKNYPLVEYYEAVKRETANGNWDVRVRKREGNEAFVLDGSQDAGKENDPEWFTDIHPNPEGVRLAVVEETKALKAHFPDALPTGQEALAREPLPTSHYESLLDFSAEQMEPKKGFMNEDQLQKATQ